MKINHVAIWSQDIERLRDFYCRWFGTVAGQRYHNPCKGFTSYFLTFPDGGARLEIMNGPGIIGREEDIKLQGLCHIALSLGSREAVDEMTERMRRAGIPIISNPRTTGDGYYESVVTDPDGNIIELTV